MPEHFALSSKAYFAFESGFQIQANFTEFQAFCFWFQLRQLRVILRYRCCRRCRQSSLTGKAEFGRDLRELPLRGSPIDLVMTFSPNGVINKNKEFQKTENEFKAWKILYFCISFFPTFKYTWLLFCNVLYNSVCDICKNYNLLFKKKTFFSDMEIKSLLYLDKLHN